MVLALFCEVFTFLALVNQDPDGLITIKKDILLGWTLGSDCKQDFQIFLKHKF